MKFPEKNMLSYLSLHARLFTIILLKKYKFKFAGLARQALPMVNEL